MLNDSIGADDLIAIAVSAGNTGAVARRSCVRFPILIEGGWRAIVDRMEAVSVNYAATGLVATRPDRPQQTTGTSFIYVSHPREAAEHIGLSRARAGQGVLLLEAESDMFSQVDAEGRVCFVPKTRALLDAVSGPGRGPDEVEDLLRALWECAF